VYWQRAAVIELETSFEACGLSVCARAFAASNATVASSMEEIVIRFFMSAE